VPWGCVCLNECPRKLGSDDEGGDGQIYRRAKAKEEKGRDTKIEGPSKRIPRKQKEIG
jgi:hypothetical protein